MASNNVHEGHRERLRNRFLETGFSGFQEHEILELLLFFVIPRVNTNVTAHMLIKKFGNIAAVMDADIESLMKVDKIGPNAALMIKFIRSLCRSYYLTVKPQLKFTSADDIENYFFEYFGNAESELCIIVNISPQMEIINVISYPESFPFCKESSSRMIAETALTNHFSRVIIGCYRTNPKSAPSDQDYASIHTLTKALRPLDIMIYDYIICGRKGTFSMRRSGAFSFK